MNAILERVARKPDGSYRVIAGRLLPGKILGGFQYAGHPSRRSQRPRAARAPARAASAARLRRVDEPHRPQGRELARHARHGERQDDRQALPAGRRLHVRHVQRLPRVGPELRVLLRGAPVVEAPLHPRVRAEPVADRRLRRVPVGRQVRRQGLRSQKMAAADPDDRLYGAARRRRVLGGAARRGLHRRPDPGSRPHRGVQQSRGREVPRRCADPASRQDQEHLPDAGESDRQPAPRCQRADIRERGRRGRCRARLGRLPGLVDALRQRDRRDQTDLGNQRARRRRSPRPLVCRRVASWRWISPQTARPTRRGSSPCAPTSVRTAAAGSWSGSNECPTRPRPVARRRRRPTSRVPRSSRHRPDRSREKNHVH